MAKIQAHIDVDVPVRAAYDQWTQFEDFPRFMEGVERVTQLDDTTLEWIADVGGQQQHWRAQIVTQEPDHRISWRSTSGARNDGTVRFEPLGNDSTRVDLTMEVEPEGAVESMGAALHVPHRQVKQDLERFRDFIEHRGQETGAWRGDVRAGLTTQQDACSTSGQMSGTAGIGSGSLMDTRPGMGSRTKGTTPDDRDEPV